jgi:hypothetical protein
VHLAYVREKTGHALIGARQWIPAEQIDDPVKSLVMGLPGDLVFRTKGQLAIDVLTEAFTDGAAPDFVCGDEVYGSCTELRQFCEEHRQGYVLRVPSTFRLTLAAGVTLTCAQAVTRLLSNTRRWEVRSAGAGSKGQRWYAWAWLATASPRHGLLIRRHLASGELAFHYCHTPQGQPVSKTRLIRAAGLRWPVEETFELGNASVAHCAFFSSGVLEQSSLARFHLDTQAAAASAADVHRGEFAVLDLMQNGLPGDAEGGGGLRQW